MMQGWIQKDNASTDHNIVEYYLSISKTKLLFLNPQKPNRIDPVIGIGIYALDLKDEKSKHHTKLPKY